MTWEVDPQLFHRACRGDREAFWHLMLPFRGLVYSVALGMCGNDEQAQDHLHDVLLLAYRSISNVREPQHLGSWLHSVTRNHILDVMRREQRLRAVTRDLAPDEAGAEVLPFFAVADREASLGRLEAAMARLPEPFRVVLGMKYMNQYSYRQIAEILGLSAEAVKSRLFEARKLLRKQTEAMAPGEKSGTVTESQNEEGVYHEMR
ncbi:MAG TPA: RNA polymerase sigma factor [Candidatus Sumerlaeota bacterium]|nr:RNA polymerase sigma factor [Candidatus Sumerlaeota bacterium]HPR99961.1 RNA polymerase sigma factor [Candidatus Sumerlaeota bacterium]